MCEKGVLQLLSLPSMTLLLLLRLLLLLGAGAYFISRQTNGTAVYHDVLPEAGLRFMDKSKLAAALG
jgi:hypothetical protein